MLAVNVAVPVGGSSRPPVILLHGAANSASIWFYWQQHLDAAGWASYALDLRGHGRSTLQSLAGVSMRDYAADVQALIRQLAQKPVMIGWSMGGLVAMMAASEGVACAYVGLEPSQPASAVDPAVPVRKGEYGAEEYLITDASSLDEVAPDLDQEERGRAMASLCKESRWARDERKAGVLINRLPCPSMVVADPSRPDYRERYKAVRREGARLGIEFFDTPTTGHWDLVLNRRNLAVLIPRVLAWLDQRL
jgi:pimeloyl-ACP methyl ester carboxylesterase